MGSEMCIRDSRWSDGLHQAVEAKERVKIERENQTLATVTFQNYFRKYEKLAGMTGTADTEAEEFAKIYKLDVMVIPTNRDLKRIEEPDTVYRTEKEKYDAIVNDIIEKQQQGRPVLVGTVSIEKSERLSKLLKLRGIRRPVNSSTITTPPSLTMYSTSMWNRVWARSAWLMWWSSGMLTGS